MGLARSSVPLMFLDAVDILDFLSNTIWNPDFSASSIHSLFMELFYKWGHFLPSQFCRSSLVFLYLWREIELDDASNWLSTLGGAYSNLGDHSAEYVRKYL